MIEIIIFVVLPVLFAIAVLTGHIWRSDLNRALHLDKEARVKKQKERIKEQLRETIKQAEMERLRMKNVALSTYIELQDMEQRRSCADIQKQFDCCQCCQFSCGPVRDAGTAEVVREIKELPE